MEWMDKWNGGVKREQPSSGQSPISLISFQLPELGMPYVNGLSTTCD